MEIKPWNGSERLYFYRQLQQLAGQTDQIGKLKADFDRDGNGFFSSWEDIRNHLKTEEGIEIYLTAVNPNAPDYDLPKMPEDRFEKLVNDLNAERRFSLYKPHLSEEEVQKYTRCSSFGKLADTGKQAINNMIIYGATTWYDWSIKNWGTKWNSYDSWKGDDKGFQFSTAWSAPHPVLDALAKKYPDVRITHEWADALSTEFAVAVSVVMTFLNPYPLSFRSFFPMRVHSAPNGQYYTAQAPVRQYFWTIYIRTIVLGPKSKKPIVKKKRHRMFVPMPIRFSY